MIRHLLSVGVNHKMASTANNDIGLCVFDREYLIGRAVDMNKACRFFFLFPRKNVFERPIEVDIAHGPKFFFEVQCQGRVFFPEQTINKPSILF